MKLKIFPSQLVGEVDVPPSKSLAHRAIIAAALSNGTSVIENIVCSRDIIVTLNAIKALGVDFSFSGTTLKVFGGLLNQSKKFVGKNLVIDCGESASSLRFLVPVVAALGFKVSFVGSARLINRIRSCGGFFCCEVKQNCVEVSGVLKPGFFRFKNCLTSQFITGLLLVLPLLNKKSVVVLESSVQSMSFVNLTVEFLRGLKIKIEALSCGFEIEAGQRYDSFSYFVEADFSNAAFFAVAGCMNKIKLRGLSVSSSQADMVIFDVLKFCGARVVGNENCFVVEPSKNGLKPFEFNLKNNLDLAPALAVLAGFCDGVSRLNQVFGLVHKESNRIFSILNMIRNLGGKISLCGNSLKIAGVGKFFGGFVDCFNDHRIAMAAAVSSVGCCEAIVLDGFESVAKSYINFFRHFKDLGGSFCYV